MNQLPNQQQIAANENGALLLGGFDFGRFWRAGELADGEPGGLAVVVVVAGALKDKIGVTKQPARHHAAVKPDQW